MEVPDSFSFIVANGALNLRDKTIGIAFIVRGQDVEVAKKY